MRFEQIIKIVLEQAPKKEEYEPLPWSIEITKDPKRSREYNELGDLIIKLFELRSRLE
jgi:hypothetical protein